MKILITGSDGFIGKNLVATLEAIRDGKDTSRSLSPDIELLKYTRNSSQEELDAYCAQADFIFHLAGVLRPKGEEQFIEDNKNLTDQILHMLEKHHNICPVMFASSIQATLSNAYGESKALCEQALRAYGARTGARILIYRFTNLFGKWSRPNYSSVVATFCHHIAREEPITVSDPSRVIRFCYIDDVIDELLRGITGNETREGDFCVVPESYEVTLGALAEQLYRFHDQPRTLVMPALPAGSFTKKLYSTYLSFLPEEKVCFPLKMNVDPRGSFTELMKTENCGQFSLNVSRPGITKGQHWHHSKWEFFMVITGKALIQEREIGSDRVLEFRVSGEELRAVHMLPGYTHNIVNLSDTENLVTLMWANEPFDPSRPDTYFEEV